jgi:hypothetical protein
VFAPMAVVDLDAEELDQVWRGLVDDVVVA